MGRWTLSTVGCLLWYTLASATRLIAKKSVPRSSDAAGDCVFLQRAASIRASTILDLRASNCDEASWPDKDHDLVCGECKVLVDRFSSFHKTCSGYCASVGRQCTGAWEEQNDDCAVQRDLTCDESIASSDAICECGAEGAVAGAACYGKFPELAVDEGNAIGEQLYTASATECQAACDDNPACKSFSLCPQWGCWMKDQSFSGAEGTKPHYDCQTYYKKSCVNAGTTEPAPAPAPAATAGEYCFRQLPNLAVEEGNTLGEQVYTASATECQEACNDNPACNSFSFCPQWGCWMKDRSFSGNEASNVFYDCQTYFKTQQCDSISSSSGGAPVPTSAPTTQRASTTPSSPEPCPWSSTSGEDGVMECMDGTTCNGGPGNWACCSVHGGRAKCPQDKPVMCNEMSCGDGDYCCKTSCDDFGGPRLCPGVSTPAVLMMGNSYTYYNGGVDGVLRAFFTSFGSAPRVQALTKGGSNWGYHLQQLRAPGTNHHTALVGGSALDFVVLQDQSHVPSLCCYTNPRYVDPDFDASAKALVEIDAAVKAAGAVTVLYQTWGRRDRLTRKPYFSSFPAMNDAVQQGYEHYASLITTSDRKPIIAPVGRAFGLIHDEDYNLFYRLYDPDATHPSALGTYLAACVVYASVTGASPSGLPTALGISAGEAGLLQSKAAIAVSLT